MKTSFQTRKITLILIGSLFIGTGILNSQVTDKICVGFLTAQRVNN